MYNTISQFRSKVLMLKSNLCNYSDAYILAKEIITVSSTGRAANPKNV